MESQSRTLYMTVTILTVGALFFLSTELIYCILTVIYMKPNVPEGNTSLKKAVAKVLGYMAIVSVLSFINSDCVLPYLFATITSQTVPIASENRTLTIYSMWLKCSPISQHLKCNTYCHHHSTQTSP